MPKMIEAVSPEVERHISEMLELGLRKHREAIALMAGANAADRATLKEILRLLDETEILLTDAATYVRSSKLNRSLGELRVQQAAFRGAMTRLERKLPADDRRSLGYLFLALVLAVQLLMFLW